MAFFKQSVNGDGTIKTVWTTEASKEASVHSMYIQNTTSIDKFFDLLFDGIVVLERVKVPANDTKIMEKPINIPTLVSLQIKADAGLRCLFSLFESALDVDAALTSVEILANNANNSADRAENAANETVAKISATLPDGTISDGTVALQTTWSSSKINEQILLGGIVDCGNAGTVPDVILDGGVA